LYLRLLGEKKRKAVSSIQREDENKADPFDKTEVQNKANASIDTKPPEIINNQPNENLKVEQVKNELKEQSPKVKVTTNEGFDSLLGMYD
jgi:PBP1b-binding outer membrane lipoprotein LpoB